MTTQTGTRSYAANPADLPSGTLVQLFFQAIDRHQREDALRHVQDEEWRALGHSELETRVRRLGLALQALGVKRGDRVALLSENRPEWAIADYASLCIGAQDVPIYATLPPNQIAYILEDSGARLMFVSTAEQLAKILEIWGELPALEHVVVFDEVEVDDERVRGFEQMLELGREEEEAGRGREFRERALEAAPDDVATILYTSGTTGQPKGVMLTHANIYSNTRAVEGEVPITAEDVALSFLPLSHILQRMVDYLLFDRGVPIAYVSSFDRVAQSMVEVRPTVVVSTPRVYEKVYAKVMSATGLKRRLVLWARQVGRRWADARLEGRRPGPWLAFRHALADALVFRKIRDAVGGRIRFFISGGAPLNPDIARFFYAAGILILEGYGLTETSPVTNVNTPDAFRFGTVGKPVPGTEIMIAADGEILVRGPQVMKGYFRQPEATSEAIDADGWFHTGDIGEIDTDGYLRITDRKKDLIVTAGGKNVAPQPIENEIKNSRYVLEAVMLGDRRPYPIVLVVPDFEQLVPWAKAQGIDETRPAELIRDDRIRRKIEEEVGRRLSGFARYEVPKKVGLLEQEFSIERGELTPTLKVRRRVVEEHFRDVVESLYAEPEAVAAE
ncbi:MAG TPA: long-chain fatty acid--CoA ligase [Longimicrobiales bacterium]